MKVWMRAECASLRALPCAVDVLLEGAGQPAHRRCPSRLRATACTASKSPGLAIGKPASMTSTRMRSSALAMRTFSSRVIDAPGLCSPSRRVVSKMINLSRLLMSGLRRPGLRRRGSHGSRSGRSACFGPRQGMSRRLPLRAAVAAAQADGGMAGRARRHARRGWRGFGSCRWRVRFRVSRPEYNRAARRCQPRFPRAHWGGTVVERLPRRRRIPSTVIAGPERA